MLWSLFPESLGLTVTFLYDLTSSPPGCCCCPTYTKHPKVSIGLRCGLNYSHCHIPKPLQNFILKQLNVSRKYFPMSTPSSGDVWGRVDLWLHVTACHWHVTTDNRIHQTRQYFSDLISQSTLLSPPEICSAYNSFTQLVPESLNQLFWLTLLSHTLQIKKHTNDISIPKDNPVIK